MVPGLASNAVWLEPSASCKRPITGPRHTKVPLISTFRARGKTRQALKANGKTEIVNIGWQPVALLEIVHARDLTSILPPRAGGVPARKSAACRTGDSKAGTGP